MHAVVLLFFFFRGSLIWMRLRFKKKKSQAQGRLPYIHLTSSIQQTFVIPYNNSIIIFFPIRLVALFLRCSHYIATGDCLGRSALPLLFLPTASSSNFFYIYIFLFRVFVCSSFSVKFKSHLHINLCRRNCRRFVGIFC